MRTQGPVAGLGQDVSTVALWPSLLSAIGPVVAATVLLAGVVESSVKRSAVALVVLPPASKTFPAVTTVAVNERRPTVSLLLTPLSLTGVAGTKLSHRSQVLNAGPPAQLSPPAISTCVALTSAAAALQRGVVSVTPVAAHEGVA